MRCINCGNNDWENVDGYRIKPQGMSICKNCGMVSYPNRYKSIDEIRKYYKSEYRKPPTSGNFFTGQKKLNYHLAFLSEYFEEWSKKEKFVVADIGAAFGMFLAWFKSVMPNAEIFGTEWDIAYKRNAFHEYNLTLTDDLDETKKYDLISLYKVAEHQMDFDIMLEKYINCLTDTGMIYISVPIWFDSFYNFGPCNCDLEYYYHPDHINQWSRKIFQSILGKCGLKIIKANYTYYDDTYLCVKDEKQTPQYENVEEIKQKMVAIKKSYLAYSERNYKESIESYANNPLAWRHNYELNRKQFHDLGLERIEEYLKQATAACPNSVEIISLGAELLMRYNLYERAIKFWKMSLDMRPGAAAYYSNLGVCFRKLYEQTNDEKYLAEARNIGRIVVRMSPEHITEALSWVYYDNAKIKTPSEV